MFGVPKRFPRVNPRWRWDEYHQGRDSRPGSVAPSEAGITIPALITLARRAESVMAGEGLDHGEPWRKLKHEDLIDRMRQEGGLLLREISIFLDELSKVEMLMRHAVYAQDFPVPCFTWGRHRFLHKTDDGGHRFIGSPLIQTRQSTVDVTDALSSTNTVQRMDRNLLDRRTSVLDKAGRLTALIAMVSDLVEDTNPDLDKFYIAIRRAVSHGFSAQESRAKKAEIVEDAEQG